MKYKLRNYNLNELTYLTNIVIEKSQKLYKRSIGPKHTLHSAKKLATTIPAKTYTKIFVMKAILFQNLS